MAPNPTDEFLKRHVIYSQKGEKIPDADHGPGPGALGEDHIPQVREIFHKDCSPFYTVSRTASDSWKRLS